MCNGQGRPGKATVHTKMGMSWESLIPTLEKGRERERRRQRERERERFSSYVYIHTGVCTCVSLNSPPNECFFTNTMNLQDDQKSHTIFIPIPQTGTLYLHVIRFLQWNSTPGIISYWCLQTNLWNQLHVQCNCNWPFSWHGVVTHVRQWSRKSKWKIGIFDQALTICFIHFKLMYRFLIKNLLPGCSSCTCICTYCMLCVCTCTCFRLICNCDVMYLSE